MGALDLDGRRFRTVVNSEAGDSGSETIFRFRQKGAVVWATYHGGNVSFGTLVGRSGGDGRLELVYQHLDKNGEFRCGRSQARAEILPDGRYRLHERWTWTAGAEGSGRSVAEEVPRRRGRTGPD